MSFIFSRGKTGLGRMMVPIFKGSILILLLCVASCAHYQPRPLTTEAVDAQLQPPPLSELRILAQKIDHPLLPPLRLQPDRGLSPDSAAVIAVLLNPSLRVARDKRDLARAQVIKAGLLPNPELSLSLEIPTGGNKTGKVNAYGLGLNWELTSLLTRGSKLAEARSQQDAVDLDIAWQEWQIAQAAKAAVYQLLVLQEQLALAEQNSSQADRLLDHVRQGVRQGLLSANPLETVQTDSFQARETQLDLAKQADLQRLQLRRLLGLPADSPLELDKDLRLPTQVELPQSKTLLQGLAERRLDLVALQKGYASQEEAVRTAIMEQFPKIMLGPTLSRDTDKVQTTGFGLNIELPILNRNQGMIAQERASRQMLFDEYVQRVFETRSDVASILAGIAYINRQIEVAQEEERIAESREKNYGIALAEERIDALTYAVTWNDLVKTRVKRLTLQGELVKAEVALQLATGLYELPHRQTSYPGGTSP